MAASPLKAHVFAIDWVPEGADVAGGGGLRSLQVIEALRAHGHKVRFSVPRASRAVREIAVRAPARLRGVELHDTSNQIDLLRTHRPDAVGRARSWQAERAGATRPEGVVPREPERPALVVPDRPPLSGPIRQLLESIAVFPVKAD